MVGALVADHPFLSESSGFVGTPSDGLEQLDTYQRLVDAYESADDGNVVQTALVNQTAGQPFTLALGFALGARARSPPPARAPRGLSPSSTVTVDGVTVTWPNVPAGQPDNVVAEGQSFDVCGTGSTLGLLGAAAFGTATGTITYTDGTTQH